MIKEFALRMRLAPREGRVQKRSRLTFFLDHAEHGERVWHSVVGTERSVFRQGASYVYSLGEMQMGAEERGLMEIAKAAVIERMASGLGDARTGLLDTARGIACDEMLRMTSQEKARHLSYFVAHDTAGSGPFSILMEDKASIEEIEVNSAASPISVYMTGYGRCRTNLRFADEDSFRHSINKFISENEKELGEESPIVDAQVGEARIHAQIRPYALSGAAASIRIGKAKTMGLYGLLKGGTMNLETLAYLWLAIDAGMNMVIAGAPASGKTTMLGAMANLIPHFSKLVAIEEEINELRFNAPIFNVVSLYGSRYGATNTRTQVLNALRMRPDRIIIGEIRGEEARELFAGANFGMPFMTTMHSGDESLAVVKKLLVKPMLVEPRALSMLDLSLHMRQEGVRSRVVSSVYEYSWLSRAEIEEGIEVGDGDSVEPRRTVSNGRTDEETILSSKAFKQFLRSKELSQKAGRRELARRIEFLKGQFSSQGSDEKMADAISGYRNGAVS